MTSGWEWVDYECYEALYYNNPGKYLVGALIENGRVRTKWGDTPPDKPVLTERAKEIIAQIRAESPYTGPTGVHVVSHALQSTLDILAPKPKPEKKPKEQVVRHKKQTVDERTAKLFDE